MHIDWFTFAAQIVNFMILVWLMKRFLFGPVIEAVARRESEIAAQIERAGEQAAGASRERELFERRNAEFESERARMIALAGAEAGAERARLIEEAGREAERMREEARGELERVREALVREIAARVKKEAFAIAEKILREISGGSLGDRVAERFAERIAGLTGEEKRRMAARSGQEPPAALVTSSFELGRDARAGIGSAIKDAFGVDAIVSFECGPGAPDGIELTVDGYRLTWSFTGHLAALEEAVDGLLEENGGAPEGKVRKNVA